MGVHDERRHRQPGRAQPRFEPRQVVPHQRPDQRVRHRGREALELLYFREHVGGAGDERFGQTRPRRLRGALLVRRVGPGVQEADRDRLHLFGCKPVEGRMQRNPVELRLHPAVGTHPFPHRQTQGPWHERLRRRQAKVVALGLQSFPHLDHVAVALRDQHRDPRALALQQRVGGHRHPVDQPGGRTQEGCKREPEPVGDELQPFHHPDRLIPRRAHRLGGCEATVRPGSHHIGERAADIDADRVGRHARGWRAHGWRAHGLPHPPPPPACTWKRLPAGTGMPVSLVRKARGGAPGASRT